MCTYSPYHVLFFFEPTRSLFLLLVLFFFLEIFSCRGLIESKNHGCLYHPPKSLCGEDQTRSRISCMSCWSLLVRRNMLRTRFALPIHQLSCSLWNSHGKYHKDTIFYSMENETNEKTYDSAHKYPFQERLPLRRPIALPFVDFFLDFFFSLPSEISVPSTASKKSTPPNCNFKCLWHALHASSYGIPISAVGMNEFSAHSMQEMTKSDGK